MRLKATFSNQSYQSLYGGYIYEQYNTRSWRCADGEIDGFYPIISFIFSMEYVWQVGYCIDEVWWEVDCDNTDYAAWKLPTGYVINNDNTEFVTYPDPSDALGEYQGYLGTVTVSEYIPIQYTITSSAGTGGAISPLGESEVDSGDSQGYTITPDTGYEIASVTVDGTSQGAISSYTFTNVTANHTISAAFSEIDPIDPPTDPYIITIGTTTGGTTTRDDNLISIIPDDGYFICGVYLDTVSIGLPNTYEVTEDGHTLGVTFCKILRPIWQASPLGKMSGNSSPLGI